MQGRASSAQCANPRMQSTAAMQAYSSNAGGSSAAAPRAYACIRSPVPGREAAGALLQAHARRGAVGAGAVGVARQQVNHSVCVARRQKVLSATLEQAGLQLESTLQQWQADSAAGQADPDVGAAAVVACRGVQQAPVARLRGRQQHLLLANDVHLRTGGPHACTGTAWVADREWCEARESCEALW